MQTQCTGPEYLRIVMGKDVKKNSTSHIDVARLETGRKRKKCILSLHIFIHFGGNI